MIARILVVGEMSNAGNVPGRAVAASEGDPMSLARSSRMAARALLPLLLVSFVAFVAPSAAKAGSAPVLVFGSGDPRHSIILAVVGEGYAAGEQKAFHDDVDSILVRGLLGADVYHAGQNAFSIYRVDVTSTESGIGTSDAPKNTAFGVSYNGDVVSCWFDLASDTEDRVDRALAVLPHYDFALVLANSADYGGCSRGVRLYVTKGSGWTVAAHEYGHSIGELFDEYAVDTFGQYAGPPVNERNCTTSSVRGSIAWADLISPGTNIPTSGSDAGTVGAYMGCDEYPQNIYRPAPTCRMNTDLHAPFCPVCARIMKDALQRPFPHLVVSVAGDVAVTTAGGRNTLARGELSRIQARITSKGGFSILSLSPLDSPPPMLSPHAGGVFYEFTKSNRQTVAGHLERDPLVARSYAPPGQPLAHRDVEIDQATVNIIAPTGSASRKSPGSFNLYQLNPATKAKRALAPKDSGHPAPAPARPAASLDVLKRSNRLDLKRSIRPSAVQKAWSTFNAGAPR
jgi:hypothetical protein